MDPGIKGWTNVLRKRMRLLLTMGTTIHNTRQRTVLMYMVNLVWVLVQYLVRLRGRTYLYPAHVKKVECHQTGCTTAQNIQGNARPGAKDYNLIA